ncbi:uncharacterized protein (DUF2147 family) [Sphingomonas jinjuensis]|uniref:Uncharacterized protein (DUF2147 family) n=1 Tax=Sphingomonas jinjuensis TaxID=535907 RepID=A0A840F6R8_9SPHN|nr:DUF2147 domain-containing protein [Sphingomonas jinjuensis]MBB4153439.1 uncharacterized protein (DUF2147 family) [Sphingomonas jinjuensis]
MRTALLAAALFLPAVAADAAASPTPVSGRWITEEGKALVEVGPCGQQICGRIVRILKVDPSKPTTDVLNPNAALRTRPIVGMVFLTGFTPDDDRWRGRIYDPQSGKTYRSELIRDGETLKVRGCIGPFCRTQEWAAAR